MSGRAGGSDQHFACLIAVCRPLMPGEKLSGFRSYNFENSELMSRGIPTEELALVSAIPSEGHDMFLGAGP